MKKWYEKFGDDDFNQYMESGEAVAVYIVRDCASDIDTTSKWIDVIAMNDGESIDKKWIVVELFPRINKPVYTDDRDENRYLTWITSHADIAEHHRKNHCGKRFLVFFEECEEYDEEQKKWREYYSVLFSYEVDKKLTDALTAKQSLSLYMM